VRQRIQDRRGSKCFPPQLLQYFRRSIGLDVRFAGDRLESAVPLGFRAQKDKDVVYLPIEGNFHLLDFDVPPRGAYLNPIARQLPSAPRRYSTALGASSFTSKLAG